MVSHAARLDAARDAISYICARTDEEMTTQVPNCPGWTVYNAAVHVGRVGIAWQSMIDATPDDPDSRNRGYTDAESRGSGHSPGVLASWALAAIDALETGVERPCYFSMTGGQGTIGLWGWHAASELGVHRLDVEHALGVPHAISDELAIDAIEYTAQYFLPAMTRATERKLDAMTAIASRSGNALAATRIGDGEPRATITGAPVDVLLALWGRPHGQLDLTGAAAIFEEWHELPSTAFQFGTWD